MRKNIPILSVLIILLFIGSCSTSDISVATIRVKHKKQNKSELSEELLVVIADTEFIAGINCRASVPSLTSTKQLNAITETGKNISAKPDCKTYKKESYSNSIQNSKPETPPSGDKYSTGNGLVLLSVIFGIIGLITSSIVVPGLIFGIIAILIGTGVYSRNKTALFGIILGAIAFIISIIVLVTVFSSFLS